VSGEREQAVCEKPAVVWATYDPERVGQALQTSAGALRGGDREQFKRELAESR